MTKVVLFDFGGTLDSDGRAWPDRFLSLYSQVGLPGSRDEHLDAFYRADEYLDNREDIKGLDLEATIRVQIGRVLGRLRGPESASETLVRGFVDASRATFRRNAPLLEKLRRRYALGIVSNFYGNLDGILKAEGLRDLFGVVADSGVVGSIKPDPAIFLHALRALGAAPSEAWMVGDSLKRDMRGAESLKMRHAFLNPDGEACCPRGARIKSLLELEAALESEPAHAR